MRRRSPQTADRPAWGGVAGIHGGQHADILFGIPANNALHRPLLAGHVPGLAILVKQPREWLPGIPADLQPIAKDQAGMGLGEGQRLKRDQARLNPLITGIVGPEYGEGDGLGSRPETLPGGQSS